MIGLSHTRGETIFFLCLFKINNRDSCSSELHMLIGEVGDIGNGSQVFTDELSENTRSCAVENTYPADSHQNGVVDEIGDGIDGLVTTHAPHIQILLELTPSLVDGFPGGSGVGGGESL